MKKKRNKVQDRNRGTENRGSLWKRSTGGSSFLMINGKPALIKPGEEFWATEEEIPESFKDLISLVKKGEKKETPQPPVFEDFTQEEAGEGLVNVFLKKKNLTKKKPIPEDKAEAFILKQIEKHTKEG